MAAGFHMARVRADRELEFAAWADMTARRAEASAQQGPPQVREAWAKIAVLHRRFQRRHLAAARLHAAHADRLRTWAEQPGTAPHPAFVAAVAEVSGTGSVVVTLSGREQREALVTASDSVARAAHDLEVTYGEGPARDAAASRKALQAAGPGVATRWPLYGPAVKSLGVHTVTAAPMRLADRFLGTLTALHPRPIRSGDGMPVHRLADALAHTLLLDCDTPGDRDAVPRVPLFGDAGDLWVIHQAAGMVAAESGVGIPAALALIRARAFADNEPAGTVAERIVGRQLRLTALD